MKERKRPALCMCVCACVGLQVSVRTVSHRAILSAHAASEAHPTLVCVCVCAMRAKARQRRRKEARNVRTRAASTSVRHHLHIHAQPAIALHDSRHLDHGRARNHEMADAGRTRTRTAEGLTMSTRVRRIGPTSRGSASQLHLSQI